MSELDGVIAGLEITVLMLIASVLVLMHIRMYMDWKEHKEFKKRLEESMKQLQKDLEEEAKRREAGNT